jgi:hypothetical protein
VRNASTALPDEPPMANTSVSSLEGSQPTLTRAATAPIELHSPRSARSHLTPEDAFNPQPPTRREYPTLDSPSELRPRKSRSKLGSRSRSRRRKRHSWKKVLWVKQYCMSCGLLRLSHARYLILVTCRPGQLYGSGYLP